MSTNDENAMLQALETQLKELEQMYTRYDFLRLPLDLSINVNDILTIITADNRRYHGKVIDVHPKQSINSTYIKLERITHENV